MRLIQYLNTDGAPGVGRIEGERVVRLPRFSSTYELALHAISEQTSIASVVQRSEPGECEPYLEVLRSGRVRSPLTHPDPAHCLISGTGLTHLGSAQARDAMHQKISGDTTELSDSMRLFKLGVEGGRPEPGHVGVQPEWFYKGNGTILVHPGEPLRRPQFALDGGEEPEIVGAYVIGPDRIAYRIGFALGNEFSDHVMERQNYLYLAHSKLRNCAIGPELRMGALPAHMQGCSRIKRDGRTLWEKPFLTGESNMCHTLANLEFHHFKYQAHRRPFDVHLHFFGTATLSFADGIAVQDGDVFEIELSEFGAPLINPLKVEPGSADHPAVRSL